MAARVILALSLLLSAAAAQKQSAGGKPSSVTANKLIALKVTGTTRYTDKEILAASGLQIGQNAADGDFKEAVQRLGDSGLFSNVVLFLFLFQRGNKTRTAARRYRPEQAGSRALRKLRLVHRCRTARRLAKPRSAVQAVAARCRQSPRPGFRGAASHPHRKAISRTGRLPASKGTSRAAPFTRSFIASRKSASGFAMSNSRELRRSRRLCSRPQPAALRERNTRALL